MLIEILAQTESLPGVPSGFALQLLAVVLAAVGTLLLQRSMANSALARSNGAGGVLLLLAAGAIAVVEIDMIAESFHIEKLIYVAFAGISVAGCVGFVTSRQPIYTALSFATAILAFCGILFLVNAPFVAAATMIIYAGAIIIIFLFVLMFAQRAKLQPYDIQLSNPNLAVLLGGGLLCVLLPTIEKVEVNKAVTVVDRSTKTAGSEQPEVELKSNEPVADRAVADSAKDKQKSDITTDVSRGRLASISKAMFGDYLFTVEIAGALLLVATIGAIVISQRDAGAESEGVRS